MEKKAKVSGVDTKAAPASGKEAASAGRVVRVKWGASSSIPTIYANHLVITHSGPQFYLVFGELEPHSELIGQLVDEFKPPDHVEIVPVAKIAVTPKAMRQFAKIIQENVTKFSEQATSDE
ncbi:MAG TPA: DUF3467 domain-containing protein [Acidobacteriota bacterium]|jgi:hypothetical protein